MSKLAKILYGILDVIAVLWCFIILAAAVAVWWIPVAWYVRLALSALLVTIDIFFTKYVISTLVDYYFG